MYVFRSLPGVTLFTEKEVGAEVMCLSFLDTTHPRDLPCTAVPDRFRILAADDHCWIEAVDHVFTLHSGRDYTCMVGSRAVMHITRQLQATLA